MKCERCVFRAQASAGYRCDYCAITGHTRLAVPPEKCLHFQKGERIDRSEEKAAPLGVEALRTTMGRQGRNHGEAQNPNTTGSAEDGSTHKEKMTEKSARSWDVIPIRCICGARKRAWRQMQAPEENPSDRSVRGRVG